LYDLSRANHLRRRAGQRAYEWLCRRRWEYSANSDIWGFRRWWPCEKKQIKDELLAGSFRFSLLSRITLKDGDETDLWSARDALVLARQLPVSRRCAHLKGHGGAKYAVREVRDHLADNRFRAEDRRKVLPGLYRPRDAARPVGGPRQGSTGLNLIGQYAAPNRSDRQTTSVHLGKTRRRG